MAETTTIKVPLEIPQPAQQPERERPTWARKSLHAVKMPRQEVQLEPQWVDNGPNVEVRWREAEPTQQQETYMENQHGNNQPLNDPMLEHVRQFNAQPGPARPDPSGYDMYDPADVAAYHQANDAYMQSVIDQRVASALQPHMETLEGAKWERQYNAAVARYGDDPNFKEVMQVALQNVLDAGGKITIEDAYIQADNKTTARVGQRGSAHLPEALRDRKKGIGSLGKIMFHNHQTGRAKPFGGRNWKG